MKYNKNFDHIRRLLDKYYRAESTADDEEILERFFSMQDCDDLPEDLAAEQKLFSLMDQLHQNEEEIEAPVFLFDNITSIMEKPVNSRINKRSIWNILRYVGGSVAACILIAIIVSIHRHVDTTTYEKLVSETQTSPNSPTQEKNVEKTEVVSKIETNVSEEEAPSKTQNEVDGEDGFIEITDPEKAQEILLKIGKLLAHNADDTNEALAQVSNSIDCYKELSKSILQ